jgi:iron complex outermembrane receptor protein
MTTSRLARSVFLAGVAFGAVALRPTTVQAQDTPAAERDVGAAATSAGDIVVTARRVEERLQDVPLSVTAFGADELDKRVINNFTDLGKVDPALYSPPSTPRTRFTPYIRGQSPGAGVAAPQAVVTYVAEAPNLQPSFFDLSNVQVIKGPQGTLFGETATGGVILFEPKRPSDRLEGYAEFQAGTYNHIFGEMALNVPIIGDRFAVRVAGQIRKRDGFTKIIYSQPNLQSKYADNTDYQAFRVSAVVRPIDDLEIYTYFERAVTKSNGSSILLHAIYDANLGARGIPNPTVPTAASVGTAAAAGSVNRFLYMTGYSAPVGRSYLSLLGDRLVQQQQLGPRAFTANYDLSLEQEAWQLVNQVTWNITDTISFKNIFGISQVNSRGSGFHIDGTDLPIIDSTPQVCVQGISPNDCMTPGSKNWSNETRLHGTVFDDKLDWQVGFYYRKIPPLLSGPGGTAIILAAPTGGEQSASVCTGTYGLPTGTRCSQLSKALSETYAAYGQATYKVIDGVSLTAGFRRTWDYLKTTTVAGPVYETTFNGQAIRQSVLGTKPLPNSLESVTEVPRSHYDTYTLGADWKITDDVMAYVTHRKGHKTGGVNATFAPTDPLRFFGPESVTDWEFGLKAGFEAGPLRIRSDIAVFSGDYSDIQRRTSTQINGQLFVLIANVAKARIRGIEWSLNVAASDYFDVNLQYALLDAKFRDYKEVTNCAADITPTGCGILIAGGASSATLAATRVDIDHVGGTKTANGRTDTFKPDRMTGSPKNRFTIQPTVHLGFLSPKFEEASLSAVIAYQSTSVSGDANYSLLIPEKDLLIPSRTLVDLRFDWKNFASTDGVSFDMFASATNVFNKTVVITRQTFINLCSCVNNGFNEPRVIFGGVRARF